MFGRTRGRLARHGKGRRSGLSLVELMVTLCVLSIGLVGVASMFVVSYRTQVQAHFASVATDIASAKIEEMQALGYNGIDEETCPPTFLVAELPSASGTLTYAPYPEKTSTNQYMLVVTVEWGGGARIAGRVSIPTVVSNHS